MPRVVIVLALASGCALEAPPVDPFVPAPLPEIRVDDRALLDESEVHHVPPPISGGSLAVSGDLAVAADPDLDRVYVASLAERRVLGEVRLSSGEEPGRVAIDGSARAHVALRRSGDVVTIDLASAALLDRVHVCAAPRGIAWDAPRDRMVVACADGVLASYPAAGGAVERVYVADDLRDIVPIGDRFLVSRFRTAEILTIDPEGVVVDRRMPPTFTELGRDVIPDVERVPGVAWRMTPYRDGALLAHQRSTTAELVTTMPGGYGVATSECPTAVHSVLSFVPSEGPVESSASLFAVVLPVDVAADPSGENLAVAAPGTRFVHAENGHPLTVANGGDDFFTLTSEDVFSVPDPDSRCSNFATALERESDGGAATAVAWSDAHGWVGLARAPSRLLFGSDSSLEIELSAAALADKGHELFHASTGSGLACASCHPEGGDDGRVWGFNLVGERRTQSVRGGIMKTAPFHWDGDMSSFDMLVEHVFAQRMDGPLVDGAARSAFARFIDAIPPMPPIAEAPDAVERGRALFHSETLACATCHATPSLSVPVSADVGTGGLFQVPPLAGVAYRAPYLHHGCAATLADRFTDDCAGGDRHGHTSHLTSAEIGDLVSYLRTL